MVVDFMLLKKILITALSLLIVTTLCCGAFANDEAKTDKVKQMREPLPYRIVSFHR